MTELKGLERARYVQGMFARIARHYDLMNRLMTFGQDIFWRREVIRRAQLPDDGLLLDLGAGTGDLGFEARRQHPGVRTVEADFTLEMMRVGRSRPGGAGLIWTGADALHLPFPDEQFDAVVSGFLLRNVIDVQQALEEQRRVLRPGGVMVALDTTRPQRSLLTPLIRLHMHVVIPLLGRLIARQGEAYNYLPASSEAFLRAEELAARMAAAGFREVGFRRLNFGTVALHWGRK
ncbi:MAG: ubiquinone/menaquinone biosynthesis methyltransferase [Anaerolineae bacterium]|nr:MAG: ubiquinone/menaquinone biosynthesis methyltransferase [Anaerolineae bacterium]